MGSKNDDLAPANAATRINPYDPEVRYKLAQLFLKGKQYAEAAQELERALQIRPEDYVLWMQLGYSRDMMDDDEGALAAYVEAEKLAPAYGGPHWYVGYELLELGRGDEAFVELRRAADSDALYLPRLLDQAWYQFDNDPREFSVVVAPRNSNERLQIAEFLVAHHQTGEAMKMFLGGKPTAVERDEFVKALIVQKQIPEAHEIWSGNAGGVEAELIDGGFERSISISNGSFGWQVLSSEPPYEGSVRIYSDPAEPHSGAHSLRLDFNGNSLPLTGLVSQLVLVKPGFSYKLRFAARTQELATLAGVRVVILDATVDKRQVLAFRALPSGTTGWQAYVFDFVVPGNTRAIQIEVEQNDCGTSPCPAYGHLWLDDFSIQKS